MSCRAISTAEHGDYRILPARASRFGNQLDDRELFDPPGIQLQGNTAAKDSSNYAVRRNPAMPHFPEICEGACVVPLCGGPVMVIFSVEGSEAYCRWLNAKRLESAWFPLSALAAASFLFPGLEPVTTG